MKESAKMSKLEVMMKSTTDEDNSPDVRDGLTRCERIVLVELAMLQGERGDNTVPTAQLYGRVVEKINVSEEEFQRALGRLGASSSGKSAA